MLDIHLQSQFFIETNDSQQAGRFVAGGDARVEQRIAFLRWKPENAHNIKAYIDHTKQFGVLGCGGIVNTIISYENIEDPLPYQKGFILILSMLNDALNEAKPRNHPNWKLEYANAIEEHDHPDRISALLPIGDRPGTICVIPSNNTTSSGISYEGTQWQAPVDGILLIGPSVKHRTPRQENPGLILLAGWDFPPG